MPHRSHLFCPKIYRYLQPLTLLGALLGLNAGARAASLNVPGDYPTVGSAVFAAVSGDIIQIEAGTYHEGVGWSGKAITLQGAGRGKTILDATNLSGGPNQRNLIVASVVGTVRIEGVSLRNGAGNPGGSFFAQDVALELKDCEFSGGISSDSGGALYANRCAVTMTNCSFIGCRATYNGGGAAFFNSSVTAVNCLFSGNVAGLSGGGVALSTASATYTNCTFAGNSCVSDGGGIYSYNGTTEVANSILWGNTAATGTQHTAGISVTYSDVQGYPNIPNAGANIGQDPLFMDADGADNVTGTLDDDLHLQAGSLCRDAGDDASVPTGITIDLDGLNRIIGPAVDMGAYEFRANTAPVATADSYAIDQDTVLTVATPGVLANDSDPDGDPLTAVLGVGPANGTVTLNQDGSFAYTPNAGFSGQDSFTYRANDGQYNSHSATVTITVNRVLPPNEPPIGVDDAYTVDQDTQLVVAAPGVLANDIDVDSDVIRSFLVTGTTKGTLTLASNGSFTYTPNAGYSGVDTFTYQVFDGDSYSSTATVTITVKATANDYSSQITAIQALKGKVQALITARKLLPADGNSLKSKLDAAIAALNAQDPATAKIKLQDFINQMTSFIKTKKLTSAQGQPLIDAAKGIIAQI